MKYSKVASLLLPKIQNSKSELDVAKVMNAEWASLKQLRIQLQRAQKLGKK